MTDAEKKLKNKCIGFVDILGFSAMTDGIEKDPRYSVERMIEIVSMLGSCNDKARGRDRETCPAAPYIQTDLDFQLSQFSDSVVVSAEISPAGVINVISHCFRVQMRLLTKGIMCRGYILNGLIYHEDTIFFGPGLLKAYAGEKNVSFKRKPDEMKATPFIEVHQDIIRYITSQTDAGTKQSLSKMVITSGELSAVCPFERLIIWGGSSDITILEKNSHFAKKAIASIKSKISELVDGADEHVLRKSEYYLHALDAELEKCSRADDRLRKVQQPTGRRMTKELAPGLFFDK